MCQIFGVTRSEFYSAAAAGLQPEVTVRLSDFTDYEVMSIKAFYGPWPRALEAAGVKEPRGDDRLQKNREKRARAKKRLREAKKAAKAAAEQSANSDNEESQ